MKDFIKSYMGSVYNDFQKEIESLPICELQRFRYDQGQTPEYHKKISQQFYLLRYFPAYLCEYKYLYKSILEDKKLSGVNILSIGCGSFIDYYAAYLAFLKNIQDITYTGVDVVDWNYKETFDNKKINFINKKLNDLVLPKNIDYNIIFFPKSLSEIPQEELDIFLARLESANFTSRYLYIISSSMYEGYHYDEQKHRALVDILIKNKFVCKNYSTTLEFKEKGGLRNIDPQFIYPDEIKAFLREIDKKCIHKLKCEKPCDSSFAKSPILNAKHIRFQRNLLERK